ncbi:internal (core) protein [Enterobacter phage 03_vB_Eclo_IJM]|nr:internal (core) protein [Enterobacter phage 03_vB_Eclo_IJM]
MALENQKLDAEKAKAGTGAQLAAGVIGAGVDPLTYVPIAGQVGKGGKLVNKMFTVAAQSGALAGASELAAPPLLVVMLMWLRLLWVALSSVAG